MIRKPLVVIWTANWFISWWWLFDGNRAAINKRKRNKTTTWSSTHLFGVATTLGKREKILKNKIKKKKKKKGKGVKGAWPRWCRGQTRSPSWIRPFMVATAAMPQKSKNSQKWNQKYGTRCSFSNSIPSGCCCAAAAVAVAVASVLLGDLRSTFRCSSSRVPIELIWSSACDWVAYRPHLSLLKCTGMLHRRNDCCPDIDLDIIWIDFTRVEYVFNCRSCRISHW